MILTRTPLRISLAGGGTDLPAFYEREPGEVISFTIDAYLYIGVNLKFDGRTRVSYSQTETVDDPAELRHDLARHTLGYYEAEGLEITSVSDIPGRGSGLGSSSAFTVGLCRALSYWKHEVLGPYELAERAFEIERARAGHPVGKQDHYAAACGGLSHYKFTEKEVTQHSLDGQIAQDLEAQLMLFWTGITRHAQPILQAEEEQIENNPAARSTLSKIRELADQMTYCLEHGQHDQVGRILHENWVLKRALAPGISEPWIDELYEKARAAGATGGKICGAGGGGFLLFAVPQEWKQAKVEQELGLRRIPFRITRGGSRVVYYDN